MPVLETKRLSDDIVVFDRQQCMAAGEALHDRYVSAEPFPHIILDDFIDAGVLRHAAEQWPDTQGMSYFDRAQERLKFQITPWQFESPRLHSLLAELNSEPMLRFLEKLTGIEKLIADPHYLGGGLHETRQGGHLSVHADFNLHRGLNLQRRINLLVYLNDDWPEEYGGALELWTRDMKECRKSALPVMGRAVVFNTDLESFHGVPHPLSCPPGRARRSIALYYYTAPEEGLAAIPSRTTIFKPRPNTADKPDWQVGLRHLMRDWVPPVIYRAFKSDSH